jgi:glycosyltransferase involved in cell wall biosynthesis
MRVLVIANNDSGLFKFRNELLSKMIADGYSVYFTVPFGEQIGNLIEIGCQYIKLEFNRRGINPFADIIQMVQYIRIIKEIKPDVVLTYTVKPNVYGGIACQITKTPYIANVTGLGTALENGGIIQFITTTLYRLGLYKAKCVFFQNKDNLNLFLQRKIVQGKIRLIPGSGVNLEYHTAYMYPSGEEIQFLFIGRIMRDKGINELLTAIGVVHDEYPNIKLNIVGGYDEDFSAKIESAQENGYILYHGRQSDVRPFIRDSHCTVLPSYHEGTANVLLESAATARPVISTRVPGCQETFDDGVTGFGCEVRNAKSLAEAMIRFINLPYEQKAAMGLAGRRKMEREFDRNIVINAYMEEIKAICGVEQSEDKHESLV